MKESPEQKRHRLLEMARADVSNTYASGEHAIIQAINAYKEIERERNLVFERLEEWYGIYFPELKLGSQSTFAKFVINFGRNKKEASAEQLEKMLGEKSDGVRKTIERSIGNEPSEQVYKMLNIYSQLLLQLVDVQEELDAYLKEGVKSMMPNVSYLIDYKLAAELLSKAGSLQRLASMPASTVQLLGAEKALFKHIRFGSKSPKYGILFRMQVIAGAGKEDRGRIARMYATKISIAARADAYTKKFIAERLKEELDRKVKALSNRPGRQGKRQFQAK